MRAQRASCGVLVFFWDYDTQWGGDRSRGGGGPRNYGDAEFGNTERLLELHADHGVPACFAVVGAAALPGARPYHDPEQIRRIHEQGHEVASHSLRHEWIPGLGYAELMDSLQRSKDAIEQCIGAPVVTFVPPHNQPFDYVRGWSFSLSERREVRHGRIDVSKLCQALSETGYRFCRLSYRPLGQRLLECVLRRRLDRPVRPERIHDVTCIRLNTPAGFAPATAAVVADCARRGGTAVVYGHPHSLHAPNPQNERWLVPLLRQVRGLRDAGKLQIVLPRELDGGR